jgi:hypothetical protein
MKVKELIGRSIIEIWVDVQYEHGGMDTARSFLLLDNDALTGFPWGWADTE